MTKIVVDASVAVKWLFPESHSEAAKRVLTRFRELIAPDLLWAEVANAIFKKILCGEVSAQEAAEVWREFERYPIKTVTSKDLAGTALRVAHESESSVYDCLYLALAYNRNCSLVTADKKFYQRVHAAYPHSETLWLEDITA